MSEVRLYVTLWTRGADGRREKHGPHGPYYTWAKANQVESNLKHQARQRGWTILSSSVGRGKR